MFSGCGSSQRSKPEVYQSISGVLSEIQICPRGDWNTVFLISFEDGRMIRLKGSYSESLLFHKGKINIITYDKTSEIQSVTIEEKK